MRFRSSTWVAALSLILICFSATGQSAAGQSSTGQLAAGQNIANGSQCLKTILIANSFPGEITLQLSGPGNFNIYKVPGGATNRIEVGGACVTATVRGRLNAAVTSVGKSAGKSAGKSVGATGAAYSPQSSFYDYANRLKERSASGKYNVPAPAATAVSSKEGASAGNAAKELAGKMAGSSATACKDCGSSSQPASQPSGSGTAMADLPSVLYPTSQPALQPGEGGGNIVDPGGPGILVTDQVDLCGIASGQTVMLANDLVAIAVEGGACGSDCGCGLMFCACEGEYACAGAGRNLMWDQGDGIIRQVVACGGPIEAPTNCQCGHRQCGCSEDNECEGAYNGVYGVGANGVHQLVKFCKGPESEDEDCEEDGAWRRKPGGERQTCSFEAPTVSSPRIRIVANTPYGEQADEDVREALGNMASLLSNLMSLRTAATGGANVANRSAGAGDAIGGAGANAGNAVGWDIPTSPGELPPAMASNMLRMGQRMADAADRWAQQRNQADLTIIGEVPMERITATCVEIEICENGSWTDGGFWPTNVRREDIGVRNHAEGPVMIGRGASGRVELERAMGRIQTWWNQNGFEAMADRAELFDASDDPCAAACEGQDGPANPPEPASDGEGAGGRDCQRILTEIRYTRADLHSAQSEKSRHEGELVSNRTALRDHPERCRILERDADDAVEDARSEWRRAVNAERAIYADAPGPLATDADRAAYDGRLAAAQSAARAAESILDQAQAAASAVSSQCDMEEARIRDNIDFHEGMVSSLESRIQELSNSIDQLLSEYRECLGQE